MDQFFLHKLNILHMYRHSVCKVYYKILKNILGLGVLCVLPQMFLGVLFHPMTRSLCDAEKD